MSVIIDLEGEHRIDLLSSVEIGISTSTLKGTGCILIFGRNELEREGRALHLGLADTLSQQGSRIGQIGQNRFDGRRK